VTTLSTGQPRDRTFETAPKYRRKPSFAVLSVGLRRLILFLIARPTGTLVSLDRARNEETRLAQGVPGTPRRPGPDPAAQIYLSGTYVRDFLLVPANRARPLKALRLVALSRNASSRIAGLLPGARARRAAALSTLARKSKLLGHLDRMLPGLPKNAPARNGFFTTNWCRSHYMLQIADRIAAVNERGLSRVEEQTGPIV